MERELGREGIGCVWVFINMFDFRHGGSNQKLLMDKKRGSRRLTGNGMFGSKDEKQLTCDCEIFESEMQSVKKLIEEEMLEKIDVENVQMSEIELRGRTKAKNRKRRSKTCKTYKTSEEISVAHEEMQSINYDSEEKFSELIKRLIAQKENEIKSCKDLLEAFQVMDKEEKISQEPVSISVSPLLEDAKSLGDSKNRECNFFSRKVRSEDTSSANESRNSQCTETIVILKPGQDNLDLNSSPGPDEVSNKAKNGRFGSRFLLNGIKRRLNFSVGKKQDDSASDLDSFSSITSQNCCLQEEKEISKKNVSCIYVAAKKHLSEMLAEVDSTDVDLPNKEVPRILGKILAFPEFSTPEGSPRIIPGHDHVIHPSPLSQIPETPKIHQWRSEDYSEQLGLDSNKDEETTYSSDISVPRDTKKEEKTILDSLSEKDAYVDEDRHTEFLQKKTFEEDCSPSSPPNSSVRMTECQENGADLPGKSSPVSVLEPFFTDDETSPSSSRFCSIEMRMKPLCIRFDEVDSPRRKGNDVKTRTDDKELILTYVEAVVTATVLDWEELLVRSFYSDKLLEPALMENIDFSSTQFCDDKKLLFDCINEVLTEFYGHEFSSGPWVSFIKPAVMANAVKVVQEEVYWHLLPLPSPHTLDQIVHKDMARTRSWMDLHFDIGCISSDTGELILDELLEEIISNCTDIVQAEYQPESNLWFQERHSWS